MRILPPAECNLQWQFRQRVNEEKPVFQAWVIECHAGWFIISKLNHPALIKNQKLQISVDKAEFGQTRDLFSWFFFLNKILTPSFLFQVQTIFKSPSRNRRLIFLPFPTRNSRRCKSERAFLDHHAFLPSHEKKMFFFFFLSSCCYFLLSVG